MPTFRIFCTESYLMITAKNRLFSVWMLDRCDVFELYSYCSHYVWYIKIDRWLWSNHLYFELYLPQYMITYIKAAICIFVVYTTYLWSFSRNAFLYAYVASILRNANKNILPLNFVWLNHYIIFGVYIYQVPSNQISSRIESFALIVSIKNRT